MKSAFMLILFFALSNITLAQIEEIQGDNSVIIGVSKYVGIQTAMMTKVELSGKDCYLVSRVTHLVLN